MKYAFASIASVKKEAKSLKKRIEEVVPGIKVHLNMYQNLAASFYGWQHFNEMSIHHDKLANNKSKKLDVVEFSSAATEYRGDSVRLITSLSFCEKMALAEHKKKQTSLFLERHITSDGHRASLVDKIFTKQSAFSKLSSLLNMQSKSISTIADLSYETQRQHFTVYGESLERQIRILHEFHIPKSIHNGGLFVLEESVFNAIFQDAEKVYSVSNTPYVVYDYVNGSASTLSNSMDVVRSVKLQEALDLVSTHLRSESDEWSKRGEYFWTIYLSHLIYVNGVMGREQQTLAQVWGERFADMVLLYDYKDFINQVILGELYENCLTDYVDAHYKPIQYRTEEIVKWIESSPMFSKQDYLDGIEQPQQFYDFMLYMLMTVFAAIEAINIEAEKEAISITDAINSKSAVFVVIPDSKKELANHEAKSILNVFRTIAAQRLGLALDGTQSDAINPHRERAKAIYPVYLDNYSSYNILGFEVVCAQLRALSYSVWFNVKPSITDQQDPLERKPNKFGLSESQQVTLAANIDNSIYLDYECFCSHIEFDLARVSDNKLMQSMKNAKANNNPVYERLVYSILPKDYKGVNDSLKQNKLIYFSKAMAMQGQTLIHKL